MKRFAKWILKKSLLTIFCFAVSALAAGLVRLYFFKGDKFTVDKFPDADVFARTFATAVFEKNYDVYRSMMHDGVEGTKTMQQHEEELAKSWPKLQENIDKRLFSGRKRSRDEISEIVTGLRCSDVGIYDGNVAAVYDFGDEGMRVIVGKIKNRLKVLKIY